MGRLFIESLALAVVAAPFIASAQAPAVSQKTYFEERLLDRAPVVVRARFDTDQSCFDVDVAAFKVLARLRGDADSRILVLGAGQLAKEFRQLDRLLFLKREPSGCLHRVIDVIDLSAEQDAIEAFVRGHIALASEVEPARRRAGIKQLILDGLSMASEFPRKLAVREADRLARRIPPVYSFDEIAHLARLGSGLPEDERLRLDAALDEAENGHLRNFAGTQKGMPRGAKRLLYLKLVQEYVQDSDAERRGAVADRLAFRLGEGAVPFLLVLLDDEAQRARAASHLGALQWRGGVAKLIDELKKPGAEKGPLIDSLGAIGDPSAVQALARYLGTAEHFDAAALALARIGGPAANHVLDGILAQLKRDPRQAPRVEALQRFRKKDFLEEDAAQRLELKGRYAHE